MVVEAILNFLVFLVISVIDLFPAVPTVDFSFLDGVFQMLSLVDRFVSLTVLSTCLVVIFVVYNAQVIWAVVIWVIKKIPGLS